MSLCEHPGWRGKACESQAEWRHCFSLFTVDDKLVHAFLLLCWKHVNASARKALRADMGGFVDPFVAARRARRAHRVKADGQKLLGARGVEDSAGGPECSLDA